MTPLVLVHGFMGGSAQWAPQLPDLADHFNVIAIDLPGFGQNAHLEPIETIGGFADWVISDLRAKDVDRYHLLGHSMGGMVVQEMMSRDANSVDRLILYATGATGVLPGRFETIDESKRRAEIDGARATARRISATWFLDEQLAQAYEHCADIAEKSSPGAIAAGLDAMQAWSGIEFLPKIRSKTLVIWGDGDRTYPWQQTQHLWQTIPAARLAVVPGCAHAVHLEKPRLFNDLVLDFLQ
ncbi:pimeloyl-ACP methyl ester carboxylesterase [Litoreibacter meonggei]|uniref:Pimeloyl-ACP methyl ester carboxylesterase n=1 Tax=Litoreibacter meonggei TaxID=1049199 RepID=A0A497WQA0_9RHOB|nr:alpha/beta fold hydrolase [Litoreibacter meonggei]RLJ52139.1 pimeloyl-ACP methyl ester carboxylesterase [Litoreibacter meonggei]